MKWDWHRFAVKMTSRKFWLSVVGFVTPLLIFLNVEMSTVESVSTLIMSFGTLVAYIIGEGFADGKKDKED